MTWNIENFFPAGSKYGPPTVAIYKDKLEVLRRTIEAQDPEVVALQEVGGQDQLDDLQAADAARLFNLAPCIPAERRFSRRNAGVNELIDHILVSQELVPLVGKHRSLPVVDSVVDYHDDLQTVTADPGPRKSSPFPDHAPVVATFEIPQ
jgi:hypothetical protein